MSDAVAVVGVAVLLAAAVLLGAGASPDGGRPPVREGAGRWRGSVPGVLRLMGARRDHGARRTGPPSPDVALVCDLVAAAVGAGLPPGRALGAALDALAAQGFAEDPVLRRASVQLSWGTGPEDVVRGLAEDPRAPWRDLAEPLLLSARTGAAASGLLTSAAASVRARRRWEAEAAAARLAASLVVPLGLCTLPAFLLLGVVPVVLSMATELLG